MHNYYLVGLGKGCPNSITPDSFGFTELEGVLIIGKFPGCVGKTDGGEFTFPDGEGNLAGGRTEFGIAGDEQVLVMGGTLTDGCPVFPLFIGVNGKGERIEGNGVFTPGGSCKGLL